MNKSVYIYAGLLVLSLGAAWVKYTAGEEVVKEGVQLVDAKPDALEKVVYTTPELTVTLEMKSDDFGRHGWVTVEDRKKKTGDEAPAEPKITRFKMGSAGDKVVEFFTPLYALRKLDAVDDAQLNAFGLKEPDTTLTFSAAGRTLEFDLGGETYGTKDRYARDKATGTLYVLDDEPLKTLKMASTRLPERSLTAAKVEKLVSVSLGVGGATGAWTQKNKEDKAAAYWERDGAGGKDESFDNWLEKALKLKSTAYVQDGETPAELLPAFDLTLRVEGEKPETVSILQGGEDYYAKSESTRGLVKLSRGAAKDVVEDAKDVAEGRAPAPEEKPATPPPGAPPGAPPAAPPGLPSVGAGTGG
jgi:hypothetical protein